MTQTTPWYPPAPAAGPASLLQLPPDDWALEPKIDGIRILWVDGHPYSRHGCQLSPGKGANRLSQLLSGIPMTLDGEWVPEWDTYCVFDLPDCSEDYDGRRASLEMLVRVVRETRTESLFGDNATKLSLATSISHVRLVANYTAGRFPQIYAGLKAQGAEGVVLKRRRSLYAKQNRVNTEIRDWLKRRFQWD